MRILENTSINKGFWYLWQVTFEPLGAPVPQLEKPCPKVIEIHFIKRDLVSHRVKLRKYFDLDFSRILTLATSLTIT
jgi:hypothetical protein